LAALQGQLDGFVGESGVPGEEPIARLASGVHELHALVQAERERVADETSRRMQAEERSRESEERYALAIRGANDGMWEWDLSTNRAHYSPRWKALLGYVEGELAPSSEEWLDRIHAQDKPRVLEDLAMHLEGLTTRFDSEHRLRHRDGTYRWVVARATAVRHANGRPSRLVGLVTDIGSRKRVQEALLELAEGLSAVHGDECFRTLVRSFASVLGVREAFVCECVDQPATRVRMLARWKNGACAQCVEFDLEGTACEDVILKGETVYWPHAASERWPLEGQFEREAYLGLPCFDSQGRVLGHIACADPARMPDELPHQAILKIFAVRAGMELERRRLEHERLALGIGSATASTLLH
jgi:PAS domain S-box-containing protein